MNIFYKTDIKNILNKEKDKLNYRSESFNVLWIRENFGSLKHLVNNYKEKDNVIFEIFNNELNIFYYIELNNITREIIDIIKKHKDNILNEILPKIIYTEYVNYDEIKSFLLFNKLSDKSPLKEISKKTLNNLLKNGETQNKYKLCVKINNNSNLLIPRLSISFDLYLSTINNKKILKGRNIKKFGDALNGNTGVTKHTTENIYIESKQSLLFKKNIEKRRLKIMSKVNDEYHVTKTKFNITESKENGNVYCPPKRSMTSENDKCVLFLSGYPTYIEEDEIYLEINDYLNNKKENNYKYMLPSRTLKKRIKNIHSRVKNNNSFSFITFYNNSDAESIINACLNKELRICGGILTASYKKIGEKK
jgi:hypothetical protein